MSGLVEWLEDLNARDTRVRAVLRRSLAFDPGTFADAFPYVEPFVGSSQGGWRRNMLYLTAGLWALHWRDGRNATGISIGRAAAAHQIATNSASTERRFISLLDSDEDQLPYRLRQMVTLLRDQSIDFDVLLDGLLYWNDDRRRTQIQWAREFYQNQHGASRETSPLTNRASK